MHVPVLQSEVIKYLDPKPGENFIDCTYGEGGHSGAILERNKPGKVLGIETDEELCKKIKGKERLIMVNGSYSALKEIVERKKFGPVHGILFDLGLSSWHLEESGRGFTFRKKEPLDMRYSTGTQPTAEKIVNFWSRVELERIFKEFGEERFARKIAERIIEKRNIKPIKDTFQLVDIIKGVVRGRPRIHPATRIFQALRIAVNDELNNLKNALPQALDILDQGGRLVVISFHSLEDRIVKNFLRDNSKEGKLKLLTKKVVRPSFQEVKSNPRARSAKLRAAQKIWILQQH